MSMKAHILAALREQFDGWEELLASLSEGEIVTPHFDLDWSIKDVVVHLWAWQQISSARMEGGFRNQEPKCPKWNVESMENWEEDADRVNVLTFERNHSKAWIEIHQNWKEGFLRFLELGEKISERDLLDGNRFPWLKGQCLAFVLVASYDHHQQHFEKLTNWSRQPGN